MSYLLVDDGNSVQLAGMEHFRMKLNTKFMRAPSNCFGFSLTELMIGLALGSIAAAAIFGSIVAFEKQRRTIGSGSDMQQNGLLALYAIEQDARDAGFGLIDSTSKPGNLPCTTINAYLPTLFASAVSPTSSVWAVPTVSGGSPARGSTFSSSPAVIADNTGLNNSDKITLHRFNSDTGGIVTGGQAALLAGNVTLQSNDTLPTTGAINRGPIAVDTEQSFHKNDFILIADSGNCGLLQVTGNATAGQLTTQEVDNPAASTVLAFSTPYTIASAASIINLGQPASSVASGGVCPLATESPTNTTRIGTWSDPSGTGTPRVCSAPIFGTSLYSIDENHDLVLAKDGGTATAVSSNIVDIQAQYGVSDVNKQAVTCWTDATGTGCNITTGDWSAPVYADVVRIKAIRVAIVARSAKMEKCDTTTDEHPVTWTKPVTNPASSDSPVISLSTSVGDDWGCYRYKVYQTIIPVRNVIWGNL